MTADGLHDRLLARSIAVGVPLEESVVTKLERYLRLLAKWNHVVNLTALPLEPPTDEAIDRLLIEPLAAAGHFDALLETAATESHPIVWFDLGSGGGSPAIPLNIVRPGWKLTMVEARARKAAFLREAVRALELPAADVENARFESLGAAAADLVTVRGVRVDERLSAVIVRLLRPGGFVALFGSASSSSNLELVPASSVQLVTGSQLSIARRDVPRGT